MAEHACTHQHVSTSAIPPASPVISTDFVPFEATLLFGQAPDWDALANAFYLIQHERRFTSRHHESKCFSYQFLDDSFASHLEEDGSAWVDAAGFFVAPSSDADSRRACPSALDAPRYAKDDDRTGHAGGEAKATPQTQARSIEDAEADLSARLGCLVELRQHPISITDGRGMEILGKTEDHSYRLRREDLLQALKPHGDTPHAVQPGMQLDALVGLEDTKKRLSEIVAYAADCHKRQASPSHDSGSAKPTSFHMAFRGNPGTGKTTVARILGRMLVDAGILSDPDLFVEVDRSDLVGRYVGWTAQQTKRKAQEALGGILFIDEAYALGPGKSGRVDPFAEEAIATLVKEMEDRRGEFICILAGYSQPMDEMLAMNPGMRDRIGFYLDLPDYSAPELLCIFEHMCRRDGLVVSDEALEVVSRHFERMLASKPADFSNARAVRRVFESARMRQATLATGGVINRDVMLSTLSDQDLTIRERTNSVRAGFQG